jgi:hypothetical protein
MVIQVEQRSVYGNIKFYPVNAPASGLASLMKQKTFDVQNLRDISRMGLEVEVVQPKYDWEA